MSVYFDASVLVSLFVNDTLSVKAYKKLAQLAEPATVSDFGCAEFASALGKRVRMRDLTLRDARSALSAFDAWVSNHAFRVECDPLDILTCEAFLRRLDLPLRTPDALNIAIAHRLGLSLLTFDATMAKCARDLGLNVESA
ncbi:MAG: type II toxin-antitoxin system VapC family toxin [Vitreimonas sp.]